MDEDEIVTSPEEVIEATYADGECVECGCAEEGGHHSATCHDARVVKPKSVTVGPEGLFRLLYEVPKQYRPSPDGKMVNVYATIIAPNGMTDFTGIVPPKTVAMVCSSPILKAALEAIVAGLAEGQEIGTSLTAERVREIAERALAWAEPAKALDHFGEWSTFGEGAVL